MRVGMRHMQDSSQTHEYTPAIPSHGIAMDMCKVPRRHMHTCHPITWYCHGHVQGSLQTHAHLPSHLLTWFCHGHMQGASVGRMNAFFTSTCTPTAPIAWSGRRHMATRRRDFTNTDNCHCMRSVHSDDDMGPVAVHCGMGMHTIPLAL